MIQFRTVTAILLLTAGAVTAGCSSTPAPAGTGGTHMSSGGSSGTGGVTGSGGTLPGTSGTLGTGGEGAATGGANATGGASQGTGGTASGGAGPGGSASGGTSAGGSGGTSAGGSGGPDAGMTTDGGAKAACPAGALLCEDFESYPTGTAPTGPWKTTTKGAGSATVDAVHAYSGTKAVHFQGSVNKDEAYIRASSAPVFPISANQIFLRFMMYVETYPNANPMHVRFSWVGTSGVSNNMDGSGYTMCTYNGVAIERVASGYLRDTAQAMTQAANQNKWVCWEWEISNTEGPAGGELGTVLPRIWREGTPLSLAAAGSKVNWAPAPFDLVQFSLFAYQSDPAIANYWFDDIAVSTARIGCPPAK